MIIGLLGVAGAGKDTAGAVLAKDLGGVTLAFAAPIKAFCKKAFGLTDRHVNGDLKEKPVKLKDLSIQHLVQLTYDECGGLSPKLDAALVRWVSGLFKATVTPRYLMQTFGTEVVRETLGKDHWGNLGLQKAFALLEGGTDAVVFTDVRFRNETLAIKRAGGKVFRIRRDVKKGVHSKHASESEQNSIPDWWCDGVIHNDGSKIEFEYRVRELATYMKKDFIEGRSR